MRTIKLCALLPALWLWLCATPTFGQDLLGEPLAQAKQANKLLFLDFTAKWCGICKQMEKNVFPEPEVARLLAERYVFVKIDYGTVNK
jgi:thiol:disulfide interchange protein